jgi:GDP-4-dehydro-6-deoxy-D-mannose reductase
MRVLITGASGFAGRWLTRACVADGDEVTGISRTGAAPDGCEGLAVDLGDTDAVARVVRQRRPEVVYHLAALSSVGRSWQEPERTLGDNVGGAVSLLQALRAHAPDARVVWVSSSEVYGTQSQLPIGETAAIAPASPYSVSKCAGEQLAAVYGLAHGLRVVIARPFSHSGPGQRPIFLLSNIARQAAGNGATRRDFTDVRDVVGAYRLLAAGDHSGVFNVCTGVSVSAAEQVAALGRLIAPITVRHVVDPALVRASEVMELRGDRSRLTAETGWRPEIPYEQTLTDTLAWWESQPSGTLVDHV